MRIAFVAFIVSCSSYRLVEPENESATPENASATAPEWQWGFDVNGAIGSVWNSATEVIEQWGAFSCPDGLETNVTAELCLYRGAMVDDPDLRNEHIMWNSWARGSPHPIVFTSWGGLQSAEDEMIGELQFMLTQPDFVRQVLERMHGRKNITVQEHNATSVVDHFQNSSSEAAEFRAELAMEQLVMRNLTLELTHLTDMVAGMVRIGLNRGFALAGRLAAGGASELSFDAVSTIFTTSVLYGHAAMLNDTVSKAYDTAMQLANHFSGKDARARGFSVGLVIKSDCISSKINLHHNDLFHENASLRDPDFFVPELKQVCGDLVVNDLAEQMVRTNQALIDLFNELKGLGKCVFPEGERAWSKSNCVQSIYETLRSHDGRNGILYSALSLAAAYGTESDELLRVPVYSEWFRTYFHLTLPRSRDARVALSRVMNEPTQLARATTCVSMIALHRAFERAFVRVKTALQVYLHTFARDIQHVSLRTTSHPCRRVFRDLEDMDLGVCKEGEDLPHQSPDTEWLIPRTEHLSGLVLEDAGDCLEDRHEELRLSLALGPEEIE